jgi:hypothetical protein
MFVLKDSLLSFPLPKTDGVQGVQYKLGSDHTGTIEYNLNKHGYRTSEFETANWKNSLVCFGCSATLGIGVSENESWPTILGQLLDIPVINLGQGGVGIDYILAQLIFLLNDGLFPKKIAVVWPSETRTTYWGIGPNQPEESKNFKSSFCQNDLHMLLSAQININAFKQLSRDIPVVEMTWSNFLHLNLGIMKWNNIDKAIDQMHPGPKSHLCAAQIMKHQFLSYKN